MPDFSVRGWFKQILQRQVNIACVVDFLFSHIIQSVSAIDTIITVSGIPLFNPSLYESRGILNERYIVKKTNFAVVRIVCSTR